MRSLTTALGTPSPDAPWPAAPPRTAVPRLFDDGLEVGLGAVFFAVVSREATAFVTAADFAEAFAAWLVLAGAFVLSLITALAAVAALAALAAGFAGDADAARVGRSVLFVSLASFAPVVLVGRFFVVLVATLISSSGQP
jgi:hypothetical protein